MNRLMGSLFLLFAIGVMAQDEVAQTGVPARLEVINGKVVKALLQQQNGSNITFQIFKSDQDITVDQSKIKSLTFYPKYDAEAVVTNFNAGDYAAVLAKLGPVMEPYRDYMAVSNNMQSALCMLVDAYRESGDFSNVWNVAETLISTGNPGLVLQGQVNLALAALADGDFQTSEKIHGEVESEAAGLYLQACMQRAQGEPKKAIKTITRVIAEHGNDVEWLAPSEWLGAQLYLDMAMTNSAANTARQVMNIYAGTHISGDAAKLYNQLQPTDHD
ncbi:MAG: hypothetical protein K9M45_03535 [Kiritimatiellales bacterium]|nr:hypothetical protein [Kiritimatiellales bacterium]